jgi:hypothetical protein
MMQECMVPWQENQQQPQQHSQSKRQQVQQRPRRSTRRLQPAAAPVAPAAAGDVQMKAEHTGTLLEPPPAAAVGAVAVADVPVLKGKLETKTKYADGKCWRRVIHQLGQILLLKSPM